MDRESPKVYDSTDSTNIENNVPNQQNTNTNNTDQLQLNESESSGKGLGDLRENIPDVRGKFGDEFDCAKAGTSMNLVTLLIVMVRRVLFLM